MNGVRFYEEFSSKRRGVSEGNVVAVLVANGWSPGYGRIYDAIVAPFEHTNCPPCGGSVSTEYLRLKCKRVSEARAREIHPRLFTMLENDDGSK
jgi:hypothetical protein